MSDKEVFVDTNVLVYYRDASEPEKQEQAARWLTVLWNDRRGRLSTQVLNEFYTTTTRKLTPGLTQEEAWADVELLMAWNPLPVDESLLRQAREVQQNVDISLWDALIVAAAMTCGCDIVLSEDLQDGQVIGRVTVCDPFQHDPDQVPG